MFGFQDHLASGKLQARNHTALTTVKSRQAVRFAVPKRRYGNEGDE
jgi:hypothetical protein